MKKLLCIFLSLVILSGLSTGLASNLNERQYLLDRIKPLEDQDIPPNAPWRAPLPADQHGQMAEQHGQPGL